MIIFGVRTRESAVGEGTFACPQCRTQQRFRHLVHKRWFTLYFIPLIPLGRRGEQVECQACFSRFAPEAVLGRHAAEPLAAILVDDPAKPQTASFPATAARHTTPSYRQSPGQSPWATTSLVLGLLSPVFLCVCGLSLLTSLGAIITGHLALWKIKQSAGQLTGRGVAITGLVLGYALFVITLGGAALVGPAVYQGWRNAEQQAALDGPRPETPESRLRDAELRVLSASTDGVASGNSPQAQELAAAYSQSLKAMRDALFTADRDRIMSLTDGQFLVHCELHSGRCAFLVHVPSYRDFEDDAKETLATGAWRLAQQTVEDTLEPDDLLAVGLRGVALYGAVMVGPAGPNESNPDNFTPSERRDLLAFFPGDGDPANEDVAANDDALLAENDPATSEPYAPAAELTEQPSDEMAANAATSQAMPSESSAASSPALADEADSTQSVPDASSVAVDDPPPSAQPLASSTSSIAPQVRQESKPAEESLPALEIVREFPEMGWPVNSLAFAPPGRLLAAGKLDSTLLVLDTDTGEQLASLGRLDDLGQITAVAFSFDGGQLIAGGFQGGLRTWTIDNSGRVQPGAKLQGHEGQVTCLAASPAAPFVLSGGSKGDLIWQLTNKTAQAPRSLAAFQRSVLAVYLPARGFEAAATDGQKLVRFDLRSATVLQTCELGQGVAMAAAFSSDGAKLAVSQGSSLQVCDTATGEVLHTISCKGEIQWSVGFLPGGEGFVSGGRGQATLWRLSDGAPVARVDLGGVLYIKPLAIANDGALLAAIPNSAGQTLTVARLPHRLVNTPGE